MATTNNEGHPTTSVDNDNNDPITSDDNDHLNVAATTAPTTRVNVVAIDDNNDDGPPTTSIY